MVKPKERNTRYVDAVLTIPKVSSPLLEQTRMMGDGIQASVPNMTIAVAFCAVLVLASRVEPWLSQCRCTGHTISHVRYESGIQQGPDWASHVLWSYGRGAADRQVSLRMWL